MDGKSDGRDLWMDGRTNRLTGGWPDGQTDGRTEGQTDGRRDRQTDGGTDRQKMDKQTN